MNKKIIKEYFAPKKYALLRLSSLILFGTVVGSITPYLFGKVIDLIVSGNGSKIFGVMLIMLMLEIISSVLSSAENYFGSKITLEISNSIKKDLLNRIVCMDMCRLDTYLKGELINRLEGDASSISSAYIQFITGILQIVVSVIVSLYFAILLSRELTIVFIFFFPLLYAGTMVLKKKYQHSIEKTKNFTDKYLGIINELFNNLDGVKSCVLESVIHKKMNWMFCENEKLSKRYYLIQGQMNFNQNLINAIFDFTIICVAGILISHGQLSIGNYVSFNQYISNLIRSASQVIGFVIGLTACNVSIERIKEILNEPIEEIEEKNEHVEVINSIKFESIYFGYNNRQILKNLNLSISKAGMYAIVGRNGCGKSTLIKLILKLYRQERGNIYINDKNVERFCLGDLRKHISYIAKEPFLLNETIRYNMTLGKNIDDSKLNEICERLDLLDFISNLSGKYDEVIGENGLVLSSGTKQKLAIARALLQDTSLWLCDEITSDLDGKVENKIINLIRELAKHKIIILISHKLSTIEKSDSIFLLDNGKIIDFGTNEELFKRCKLYQQIFDSSGLTC